MKKFTALAVLLAAMLALSAGCAVTEGGLPTSEPTLAPTLTDAPAPTNEPGSDIVPAILLAELQTDEAFEADVDGDGALETLLLTEEADEEAVFETSIYLTVTKNGQAQKTKVVPTRFFSAFYMETAEKKRLMVSGTYENDVEITSLLEFSGTDAVELSKFEGGVMIAEEGFAVLLRRLYALGTWDAEVKYQITKDLELVPSGEEWTIYGCSNPLTVIKELPVQTETDACAYVDLTLPVGTKLWLTSGDGESFVHFSLEDGTIGRLNYEMKNGIATLVDGTPDMEWLDGIIYAG